MLQCNQDICLATMTPGRHCLSDAVVIVICDGDPAMGTDDVNGVCTFTIAVGTTAPLFVDIILLLLVLLALLVLLLLLLLVVVLLLLVLLLVLLLLLLLLLLLEEGIVVDVLIAADAALLL